MINNVGSSSPKKEELEYEGINDMGDYDEYEDEYVMEGEEEVGLGGKALERNQFDRRSQLRRSKKQRKKSSMSSSPPSPCKTISASVDSSSLSENYEDDQKKISPVKSETLFSTSPRTASGIVRAEMRSEKLTQILLNSSRTEYNSNYGNLI